MELSDRTKKDPAGERTPAERLPPGQTLTEKWPVLTYGDTPSIGTSDWKFSVSGLVERPFELDWNDLMAMPAHRIVCDMHCVTRWSKLDSEFEGVRMRDILERAGLTSEARYAMAHCYGGYTTNVPVADLMRDDVLLAFRYEGLPLEAEHGGPCRLLVPHLYLWKSPKWINGLELIGKDRPGFWERAGYHMYGDPWKEERHGWNW